MTERKLDGKVALITGGARGLGRGYALRLAALGADIAIIDRNLKAADVYEFERQLLTVRRNRILDLRKRGARARGQHQFRRLIKRNPGKRRDIQRMRGIARPPDRTFRTMSDQLDGSLILRRPSNSVPNVVWAFGF